MNTAAQSLSAASRAWFRLELKRVLERAADFTSFALPVFDDPADAELRKKTERDARITPTAIVLLGLAEVVFVAFLVGRTYGGLNAFWKVILALACAGFAAYSTRLIRLLRARKPRPRPEASLAGFAAESPLNPS